MEIPNKVGLVYEHATGIICSADNRISSTDILNQRFPNFLKMAIVHNKQIDTNVN